MSIPELNLDGYLPVGIHSCALAEVEKRFGSFDKSDRRIELFSRLEQFIRELKQTGLVCAVIVDGSFVTDKSLPDDIDLIVALIQPMDFSIDILPSHYNSLSRKRVRARYGFDVFVDPDQSVEYKKHVAFFQKVRNSARRKGVLRIEL